MSLSTQIHGKVNGKASRAYLELVGPSCITRIWGYPCLLGQETGFSKFEGYVMETASEVKGVIILEKG